MAHPRSFDMAGCAFSISIPPFFPRHSALFASSIRPFSMIRKTPPLDVPIYSGSCLCTPSDIHSASLLRPQHFSPPAKAIIRDTRSIHMDGPEHSFARGTDTACPEHSFAPLRRELFPCFGKQPNGRAEGMTRSAKKDRDEGGKWRGQNTMRDGSHDGSPSLASVRTAGVRPAVQSAVCHLCFSSLFPILFLLQFPFNRERYKQSDADAQGDAEPGGGIMF